MGGLRLAGLSLAWLAGVGLQLQQPALWPLWAYASLAVIGPTMAWLAVRRSLPVALAGASALAFAVTGLHADRILSERLSPDLEGQDLVVTGVVASLPRAVPGGSRFVFDIEAARQPLAKGGGPAAVPSSVSLGWYREADEGDFAGAQPEPRAGERWQWTVRLRAPHGSINPHGFDYELWLFEQGLRATGSVRLNGTRGPSGEGRPLRLAEAAGHPVERWRQQIKDAIYRHVDDPRAAGVLAALAVGDQTAIERSDWDLFRATGIAHLVSISGLHITMFAWLAGALIGKLWRRSERLVLAWPAPLAARWGGLAAAAGYALLAGWGVPAQRTVWMLATAALLSSLHLRWPWLLVLLVAAWVVTALDPWALMQPGFWLSFAAVGLLMASAPSVKAAEADDSGRWQRLWTGVRSGLRTQVIATLGLAPLSLVFFQQLSLVGFLANLVAIPAITLLITPLALLGTLAPPLWQAGAWAVEMLVQPLQWLAGRPGAVWTVAIAPVWAQVAGLLGGALLVMPLPWRLRALALPLLLPLLWPAVPRPAPGAFDVVAADIGQGTAVLVRTRDHLLVYDTGPQYSRDSNAGDRVLLPLLQARGEHRIDMLMLSHRDTDHVGGAASLMAGLPVSELRSSLEAGHPLLAHAVAQRRCQAGQAWTWDGVYFEVLHPLPEDYERRGPPNALSCVLRIADGSGHSLLLAGDIEAAQEAGLAGRSATALRSDVLVVPHHGSKTSSTEAFLDAVQPGVAVFQAGYRNRFGHPAPSVLERYRARGIAVMRSDACGAWSWSAGGMRCERDAVRRYWHHRLGTEDD